jgi:hypothetical protein
MFPCEHCWIQLLDRFLHRLAASAKDRGVILRCLGLCWHLFICIKPIWNIIFWVNRKAKTQTPLSIDHRQVFNKDFGRNVSPRKINQANRVKQVVSTSLIATCSRWFLLCLFLGPEEGDMLNRNSGWFFVRTTLCYIPEDTTLGNHWCENPKS